MSWADIAAGKLPPRSTPSGSNPQATSPSPAISSVPQSSAPSPSPTWAGIAARKLPPGLTPSGSNSRQTASPSPETSSVPQLSSPSPIPALTTLVAGTLRPGSAPARSNPPTPSTPSPQVQTPPPSFTPSTDPTTTDVPDGTLCVAVMGALRPRYLVSAEAKEIRSTNLNEITYHHGPFTEHKAANQRIAPVMDALATIAVSEREHEVIAVALRLTGSDVELIVSGNTVVPQETIQFLKTVWQQLKELSKHYSMRHTGPRGDRDITPPMNHQNEFLHDALCRYVFKFSIARFRKQFTKYWVRIFAFVEGYRAWKKGQLPDFIDETKDNFAIFTLLFRCLVTCSNMLSKLEQDPKDEESLKRLINYMQLADIRAEEVLVSLTDCETWVSRVSKTTGERTKLRRAIIKITSFYRQIDVLILSAFSPRLSAVYERRFSITAVPVLVPTIPVWPTEMQQWCKIRDAMYGIKDYEPEPTAPSTENIPKVPAPVIHCEVSLILYLDSNSDKPTFNYIGVSKLSCKACHLWIDARNECAEGIKRYTGGTHDKWYPWCMPPCSEEIERKFIKLVATEYCLEKAKKGQARPRAQTDSTAASLNKVVPCAPEKVALLESNFDPNPIPDL
ncbi:hypothetical protein BDD12DRAFT_825057 [Trichophaea hybrida]|nr:hypothetical protein BDD12DRAFT_825057 [Trichophaea hybrida]